MSAQIEAMCRLLEGSGDMTPMATRQILAVMATPADRPTTDHGAAGFCTDHGQAADRPTRDPYPPAEQSRDEAMRETIVAVLTLRGIPDADVIADMIVTTAGLVGGPLDREKCGWCGGPAHDPGDCTVAQWAEAQRLCDADRRIEEGDDRG